MCVTHTPIRFSNAMTHGLHFGKADALRPRGRSRKSEAPPMEEGEMTNRSTAVLSIALMTALLSGCNLAANDAARVASAAASIPSGRSPLSGTWYGSAWEVSPGASQYSADDSLRINDDGTWTMTESPSGGRPPTKYSGTSTVHGNRVILSEANGRRSMSLTWSGRRLYGLANVNSRVVMMELIRVEQ